MTRKTAAIHTGTALTLLLVLHPAAQADNRMAMTPKSIEIFTTGDQPISSSDVFLTEQSKIAVHIYKLDAIAQIETRMSQGLSADPERARRQVFERLQRLSKSTRSQLEHSAHSLTNAVQYGVKKYPAIVFDGELVVYGLTDLTVALMQYRRWQAGEAS